MKSADPTIIASFIADKSRAAEVSASLAGVGFIPAITDPAPGTPAALGVAYLIALRDRVLAQIAFNVAVEYNDNTVPPMGKTLIKNAIDMEKALAKLSAAMQNEAEAAKALAEIDADELGASMRATGRTNHWGSMFALAASGDDPFLRITVTVKAGDAVTITRRNPSECIIEISRDDHTVRFFASLHGSGRHSIESAKPKPMQVA